MIEINDSGILAVDDKFEFTAHKCSKDRLTWNYSCKFRLTPKVKCPVKARVVMLCGYFRQQPITTHVNQVKLESLLNFSDTE